MKKITAIILALLMVLGMASSVFAAETGNTITITNAQNGETYTAYKMFNLSVDLAKNAFTYTVNSEWAAFFGEGGAGAAYVTIQNGNVTEISNAVALADAASEVLSGKTVAATAVAADGEAVLSGLTDGYFLVTSTNGTIAMTETTPDNEAVTIAEKNEIPAPTKTVKEDSTDNYGSAADAQIGDTIEFKATFNAKKGAKNYVFHDTMTEGLTLIPDSITVTGVSTGYEIITTGLTNETFKITFVDDFVTANTDITITYSAVLNENAAISNANKNTAKLTWGDQSSSEGSEVTVSTYKFEVLKYDATDNTKAPLAGAEFKLMKGTDIVKLIKVSDTEYRVANGAEEGAQDTFKTVSSGNIVIKGVDNDDDYTLVEVDAPAGFNPLTSAVSLSIGTENSLVQEVPNAKGAELPSTGGIGTTIFYVLGSIMLLGAAVMLVTKKRMSAE